MNDKRCKKSKPSKQMLAICFDGELRCNA